MTNRRTMFLHTGAGFAVPLPVDPAAPRQRRPDLPSCTESGDDPVAAEVLRQFKAGVRAQLEGKGEGARQAASALRVMAAYGRVTNLDDELRHALQREIDAYGRESVLVHHVSPSGLAADGRERGLDRVPALVNTEMAVRRLVVESLLSAGVTPHLIRAAQFFDTVGADLDARAHGHVTGAQPQQCADLREWQEWIAQTEIVMGVACLSPSLAMCALCTGVYIGARIHQDARSVGRAGDESACAKPLGFQEFG